MNLEMHLRLNLELASNEFLTEFAFKIRKIPSGFALVRQCREQATLGRTHASVGGHALPPHPLILQENKQFFYKRISNFFRNNVLCL